MEQTLAITPFQREEFGDLVTLPDRVKQWKVEADDLKGKADRFNAALSRVDWSTLSVEELENYDQRLQRSISTIATSFQNIETQRKAATAIIDEIKAYCMLPEKSISSYPGMFKGFRDAIAQEKAARIRKAEAARAAEVAKKQEAIEIRAKQQQLIRTNFNKHLSDSIQALHNKFYQQPAEKIEAYGKALQEWTPSLKSEKWIDIQKNGDVTAKYHSIEELDLILKSAASELFMNAIAEFTSTVTTERDRLIELIPSRKRELEEIAKGNAEAAKAAEERQKQEEADRTAALAAQQADQQAALAASAEIDKTNALFDAESAAEPVTQLAKGTVVRKKYQPTTHKAFAALLQSWVKNAMPLMTMEELAKRLSFVLTAANERLNKGEVIEAPGLNVVEDYSTRTSRKKEVAA